MVHSSVVTLKIIPVKLKSKLSMMSKVVVNNNSWLLLPNNLFLLPLKPINHHSNSTPAVFSLVHVDKILIMVSLLLVTVQITEKISGKLETHGEPLGEKKVILEWPED